MGRRGRQGRVLAIVRRLAQECAALDPPWPERSADVGLGVARDHVLLAAGLTIDVLIAKSDEERDLNRTYGGVPAGARERFISFCLPFCGLELFGPSGAPLKARWQSLVCGS